MDYPIFCCHIVAIGQFILYIKATIKSMLLQKLVI